MGQRLRVGTLIIFCAAQSITPAAGIADEILITQTKALQGGITPGDSPGFPITLTQPGTYKFGSDITPPPGVEGIVVQEADITIDLNGFRLYGMGAPCLPASPGFSPKCATGIIGYSATTPYHNLTIRNGTIDGFSRDGINGNGYYWIVENMRITANGAYGIVTDDEAFRIVDSTITANGLSGIYCLGSCHIESNLMAGNGSYGVEIISGLGSLINNTIINNKIDNVRCYYASCRWYAIRERNGSSGPYLLFQQP